MKKLVILVFALTCGGATFAQTAKGKIPYSESDTGTQYVYTCTMHPEVITDRAGKCPKCGMDLVKKQTDKIYTCPMHPDVISNKPGKCQKCGMDLVEKKSSPKAKDSMQ